MNMLLESLRSALDSIRAHGFRSLLTSLGIAYLPVDVWTKGFLGMGLLFTIGSCFSLAKTVRDDHEAELRADPNRTQPAHPFRSAA